MKKRRRRLKESSRTLFDDNRPLRERFEAARGYGVARTLLDLLFADKVVK